MSLSKILDIVVLLHRKRYAEFPSDLEPVLMTFQNGEMVGVAASPVFADPELKHLTKPAFRMLVNRDAADSYVFSSEAWMSIQKASDTLIQPCQDPERVETLVIVGCSPTEQITRIFVIVRDSTNKIIDLVEQSGMSKMQTRFNIYEEEKETTYH